MEFNKIYRLLDDDYYDNGRNILKYRELRDYEKTEYELDNDFNSIWFRVWNDKKITWFSVKNDLNGPNISELFSYSTASYITKCSSFNKKLKIETEFEQVCQIFLCILHHIIIYNKMFAI